MGKHSTRFKKRKRRVRGKVSGTNKRPRISVFRSNNAIYAQLIDDEKQETLASVSSLKLKKKKDESKIELAARVGEELAKSAKKKKIKDAVFDRSGYKYHGRVKALADGARKGGLNF